MEKCHYGERSWRLGERSKLGPFSGEDDQLAILCVEI